MAHITSAEVIKVHYVHSVPHGRNQFPRVTPCSPRGILERKHRKGYLHLKDKFETFRASEKERQELKLRAKKAKMSKSDYIRHCIFSKDITVIDGLDDFTKQLKAIGNNLNQLTTRANMGHFETINLAETKEQLGKIYEQLTALCRQESVEQEAESVNKKENNSTIETENMLYNQEIKQELSFVSEIENERKGLLSFLNRRA